MSPEEARLLLLREGLSMEGVAVCVRMGDDPGAERLDQIALTITIVNAHTRADNSIDRELMLALWAIAYHGETQSESWQKGGRWRNGEYNAQIADIATRVEEFIAGNFKFSRYMHDS